ncbi:MAG: homoserine O-acetyltransferase [Microthrixaceae bacterium]
MTATPTDADRPTPIPASGAWRVGDPVGQRRFHTVAHGRPFRLEGGEFLPEVHVAYETWGELNAARDNAVLVCHALTGDSHAAGRSGVGHPTPGWWDALIGSGRALDTDRDFVVCVNVLGGCQGSTGPSSTDPRTGEPFGSAFPVVTIRDSVRTQASLADELGIERWRCVVGGSMGGMQALEWAVMFPDRLRSLVLASTAAQASAQQIAWSHIGRSAILADAAFRGGDYYGAAPGTGPHRGLRVARMAAQVTYRSDEVFTERFDRTLLDQMDFRMEPVFDVEGYLDYHGDKLARRFDANSYLHLNRAMDLHDVGRGRGGLQRALARIDVPVLVASVRSDVLYPPVQQRLIHDAITAADGHSVWVDIDSPHGHDGFLIETNQLAPQMIDFLETTT